MMATLFVLHRVANYDSWREVYDSVGDMQRDGGVVADAVYQAEGDPNNVLVMHQFGSLDAAHAFVERSDLREAMDRAGVDAATLRFEFYEDT
jgi:hypothetical protein